jgi:magnesium transporter
MNRAIPRPLAADATAADHLLVRVPVVSNGAWARDARAAALSRQDGAHVYVIGEHGELAGTLSVTKLFAMKEEEPIASHLQRPLVTVRSDEDQERLALAAIRHGLTCVPVADASGRFLGIVPASALLRVLHHEHVEDIDRLAGILRQTEHAAHALEEPPSRRVRERLPWLLVGFAGSALATLIVATFQVALEQRIAVAFFIPGIVYLADAIGTQTEWSMTALK